MTWGSIARNTASNWAYNSAYQKTIGNQPQVSGLPVLPGSGFAAAIVNGITQPVNTDMNRAIARANGINEEAVLANMTPEQRAVYQYSGETPDARQIRLMSDTMQGITGEDITTTAPVLRKMSRAMGADCPVKKISASCWPARRKRTATPRQNSARTLNSAEARGYREGTDGYSGYISRFLTMSQDDRVEEIAASSQIARYGGMLSPYFSSPTDANKFVAANNITTQPTAQAIQGYLGVAGQFGQSPDEVLGYTSSQGRGMKAITYADQVKALIDRVGNYLGLTRAQVWLRGLGSFGVGMPEATVAVEQYGITNDAQAGAMTSYLGMAQNYGYNDENTARMVSEYSQAQTPFQTNIMGGIAQNLIGAGASFSTAMSATSGLGLSDHQATLARQMAQRPESMVAVGSARPSKWPTSS